MRPSCSLATCSYEHITERVRAGPPLLRRFAAPSRKRSRGARAVRDDDSDGGAAGSDDLDDALLDEELAELQVGACLLARLPACLPACLCGECYWLLLLLLLLLLLHSLGLARQAACGPQVRAARCSSTCAAPALRPSGSA